MAQNKSISMSIDLLNPKRDWFTEEIIVSKLYSCSQFTHSFCVSQRVLDMKSNQSSMDLNNLFFFFFTVLAFLYLKNTKR